jgi:hypothetical protein
MIVQIDRGTNIWKLDASLVTIRDSWIQTSLPNLVNKVCSDIGITDGTIQLGVSAKFRELLLYEKSTVQLSNHFAQRLDTSSHLDAQIFGTLLIQLPTVHKAGDIIVEQIGSSEKYHFSSDELGYYCAFYYDCNQVLEPLCS